MDSTFLRGSLDKTLKDLQVEAAVERARREHKHNLLLVSFDIDRFPRGVLELKHLQKLCLSKNALSSLPEDISGLSSLLVLSVDYNNLSSLPSGLFSVKSLRKLNLNHNPLGLLPPQIGQLVNLEVLWLNGTNLKSIPPEIKYLTALDTLGARGNSLKQLPDELFQLESLRGNEINKLSDRTELSSLIHLNLSNNRFTQLPTSLLDMENLRYCFFNENPLTTVSNDLLNELSHLFLLDLRGCGLLSYIAQEFPFVETHSEREEICSESESDEGWMDSIDSSELDSPTDEDEDFLGGIEDLVWFPFVAKYTQ